MRFYLAVIVCLELIGGKSVRSLGQDVSAVIPSSREPAAFAGLDQVVVIGEPITFFGEGSSPDDWIVEYMWDFEFDGVQDFVSGQTGNTKHIFTVPGDYQCVLTVKDSSGRIARDSRRIIVIAEKVDAQTAEQMLNPRRISARNAPDGITHRYAVMINGGRETRFWTDVELAYEMLTEGCGFLPSDIYLLNCDGTDPDGNNPDGMIDYSARYGNLETVIDELVVRTDLDDEIFIWITDHGRGYHGPLSQGGQYLGYCDSRISVDQGDEPDFLESAFKLRSIFTGGDYRCNHGLNVWKVRRRHYSGRGTNYYRNKYVSILNNVYIEELGMTVSNNDVYIERLVDYALGDTNRDSYIDTSAGEVFDYDGDGNEPYNHATGEFDEGDWGAIDKLEDKYNSSICHFVEGGSPYQLFDEGFQGKLCIDLRYMGGPLEVDGRDEDNAGLFDWMDVNQDGDTNDVVSVDEAVCLSGGPLYDDELAELVKRLSVAKITIVALPCFSGGLVEDLSSPNCIICTATTEEAVSWGNIFIRGFAAALHNKDQYGNLIDADTDKNGYTSMLEAFNYAAGSDPYDEIPQYDDNGDGVSHTHPVPADGDGVLGSDTYLKINSVVYVDDDAIGKNNGLNWANAFTDLQQALRFSAAHNNVEKIRVAEGFYRPAGPSGDHLATFQLINRLAIYGGYGGFGATEPNVRDLDKYETILSGDLNGNDMDVDELPYKHDPCRADNSYHVVTGSGTDETAVLDGFTITGGNATGPHLEHHTCGGGMHNVDGSPTVINCTFRVNFAQVLGGGMTNTANSDPTITNCTFTGNSAQNGGGMCCELNTCNPIITNCTFKSNLAVWGGGGMTNLSGRLKVRNCKFIGNSARWGAGMLNGNGSDAVVTNCNFTGNSAYEGGAIYKRQDTAKLTNCILSGNQADFGGGIYAYMLSSMAATNCTFCGNSALHGNALACDSKNQPSPSTVDINSSILWDTGDEIWKDDISLITITYSDVQGSWSGQGNIDEDPCFADPGYWDANGTPSDSNDDFWVDGDLHLKSQAGRWHPRSNSWIYDDVTSPCIDAGDPNSDYTSELWPHGKRINMGAYGGTTEASMSLSDVGRNANLDNDSNDAVDARDLCIFVNKWCYEEFLMVEDLDRDGNVNFKDFAILASYWLEGTAQ